jgi:ketosteroid isomerase-like protein
MDRQAAQRWLDRYVDAWRTMDRESIGELFTDDAEYRARPVSTNRASHPADEPVVGREAIVEDWLEDPDEPGSWEARYEPFAVDGDRAVAIGFSSYFEREGQPAHVYDNVFVMEFDPDGRCRSFTEWFRKRPTPEPHD